MVVNKVVLSIIGGLFQGLAAGVVINKQINERSKFKKLKLFICTSLDGIISLLFIPNQFRFVYCFSMTAIILYWLLEIRDIKAILYSFNMQAILAVSEIIVTLVLILVGINPENLVNNNFYNLLTNMLVSAFAIGLVFVPFVKKIMKNIELLIDKNRKFTKNLIIILIIIYLIVSKNGLELILKSNYYVNILFIVGIVIILMAIIKNENKYEKINEENKMMLSYVTKYEKIITEKGKANHEFKNQLMVIRGYAQMNSPKLIEYIDSLAQDANKTHSSYLISQLNNFPDGGVKGLLYYKLSVMEDYKINYQMNVAKGVKSSLNNLNTEFYKNITKILGVLLDNAIDASNKSKAKKVIIDVCKEKGYVNFNIYNTYKGKIDLTKIGTGFSTKGSGHGYGLKLVKDIIDNNNEFILENYLEDAFYVTKLSVKITKKKKKIK